MPIGLRPTLTGLQELELDEEGTRISLTIVDTPGFGDQIDNEQRCGQIHIQFGSEHSWGNIS